ncbi:RNA polymerase sigma factor [Sinanaerobacter chloroacetimidivorans]|uniref:RNA polymerase sigma factor n=1 Tax=Sinanaerobacter chloroacetimidivorans TaxID=2818044 RepID=A0A8J7W0K6_9FIRM|nr:RNA polymerase sigma factor [Sinanaerobacter chloroacetimidivorans]MBR0598159.1 RNA polymerase sigma factor [Sinanaerobacter chloroacetimidivorans]
MKERFREIYENYKDAVYGYLFYMTHDEQTAQDLSQETFLKIYLGLKRINEDSNLKAWCMIIARNTFLSYARKKKPFLLGDELIQNNITATDKSPEDMILQSEEKKEIQRLLLKLNEYERTVLILRDYEGLSYADIAGIMELTETVVKVRIYRARSKLRKLYEAVSGARQGVDS